MALKHADELRRLRREKHPPKITYKDILEMIEKELDKAVENNKATVELRILSEDTSVYDLQEATKTLRTVYGYKISPDIRDIYPDGTTWVITCSNF